MRWTKEQYEAYTNRRRIQNPQSEPVVQHEPHGPAPRAETSTPGIVVRIASFRRQLLDPDNLVGGSKYVVDGLRYAKLIPDDSPDQIILEVRQVKVQLKSEERTEIELIPTSEIRG